MSTNGRMLQTVNFTEVINGWLLLFFVVVFFVQHPGQQFFSHVGTEPPLPGYLPVLLGSLGVLLKEQ